MKILYRRHNSSDLSIYLKPSRSDLKHPWNLSFSAYPCHRQLSAKSYTISPFESYVWELNQGGRSTYVQITPDGNKIFGLILSVLIFGFFMVFNVAELFSVESLVSVLAAYSIGKEAWQDIDGFLIEATKNLPIRWTEIDFFYRRQNFGTLQRFWQFARHERFGYQVVLPTLLDFITHSNSKTIDMHFTPADLSAVTTDKIFRVLNLSLASPNHTLPLMLIFKLTSIRPLPFCSLQTEIYQSLHHRRIGIVTDSNTWINNHLTKKTSLQIGRLRIQLTKSNPKAVFIQSLKK